MSDFKLQKIVPVRYIASSWVPLILIAILDSNPIYNLIKFVMVIWILLNVFSSFRDYWKEYETLGAFVTINTVLFAIMVFFNIPSWLGTLFVCEYFLSFATMFRHIDKYNQEPGIRKSEWEFLVDSVDGKDDKRKFQEIINKFLATDKIDPKKFLANSGLLLYHDKKNYKINVEIRNQEDLSDHITPSIEDFASIGSQPMAFTGENKWFLIAYPDVVKWLQNMSETQAKKIFSKFKGKYDDNDYDNIDNNDLRVLVDEYKAKGKALECV